MYAYMDLLIFTAKLKKNPYKNNNSAHNLKL